MEIRKVNVYIIGAGIIGMTSAYRIKTTYPYLNVTVVAKEFTPKTTSDGSGGFWTPHKAGTTPEHLIL